MNRTTLIMGIAAGIVATWLATVMPVSSLPSLPPGDPDCDGQLTSKDAMVMLQFDSGLIEFIPCFHVTDGNVDGYRNSLDALLILQIVAGLCCFEPLTAEFTIEPPTSVIQHGEPITLVMTITNPSEDDVIRGYSSGQDYDFFALNEDGEEVWQWASCCLFTLAFEESVFLAGETVEYSVVWDQSGSYSGPLVQPGTYELLAYDVGCNRILPRQCGLRQSLTIEILP